MNSSASARLCVNFISACEKNGVAPTQLILTVSIAEQTISLFQEGKFVKQLPCSTSRFGIGQTEGSQCTPLGLHRIAEKIGAGEPAGTVFKARQIIGHTSQPEFADAKITTRILWLTDLNPASIVAAMWIHMRVTFTSTARQIRIQSANQLPMAASTLPTRI
ncbi:MAG: L,D-transpeptidase [Limisphaerales bacterium]